MRMEEEAEEEEEEDGRGGWWRRRMEEDGGGEIGGRSMAGDESRICGLRCIFAPTLQWGVGTSF